MIPLIPMLFAPIATGPNSQDTQSVASEFGVVFGSDKWGDNTHVDVTDQTPSAADNLDARADLMVVPPQIIHVESPRHMILTGENSVGDKAAATTMNSDIATQNGQIVDNITSAMAALVPKTDAKTPNAGIEFLDLAAEGQAATPHKTPSEFKNVSLDGQRDVAIPSVARGPETFRAPDQGQISASGNLLPMTGRGSHALTFDAAQSVPTAPKLPAVDVNLAPVPKISVPDPGSNLGFPQVLVSAETSNERDSNMQGEADANTVTDQSGTVRSLPYGATLRGTSPAEAAFQTRLDVSAAAVFDPAAGSYPFGTDELLPDIDPDGSAKPILTHPNLSLAQTTAVQSVVLSATQILAAPNKTPELPLRPTADLALPKDRAMDIKQVLLAGVDTAMGLDQKLPTIAVTSILDSSTPFAPVMADRATPQIPPTSQLLPSHQMPPQQLAAQILPMAQSAQNGPVEVVLNPAELGHLRFEIHQKGEHVQVVLTAERPETLDLLRRYADQLTAEFRHAGFAGASLSFSDWGHNQNGPATAQPPNQFASQTEDDARALTQTPVQSVLRDPSRNLNLRL